MTHSTDERLRNHFGIVRMDRVQGRIKGHQLALPAEQFRASGNTTLTTSDQDVPGCTYTVEEDGLYEVHATFQFSIATTGVGVCVGSCFVNGVAETGAALYNTSGTGIASPAQTWLVDVEEGDVIKLSVLKFSASGVASCQADNTTLTVRRIG